MRHFLIAAIAAVSTIGLAQTTSAADLPAKAPAAAPIPVSSWEGPYVGVHGGYAWWSREDVTFTAGDNVINSSRLIQLGLYPAALDLSAHGGGMAGVQVGYNHVFGRGFLAGVEFDGSGVWGMNGSAARVFQCTPGEFCNTFVERSLTALATLRARLGWLVTPTTLLYGTGGLAVGHTRISTRHEDNVPPAFSSGQNRTSGTPAGWTAGGGIEQQINRQWSVKVEYLYVDLGSDSHRVQLNAVNFKTQWDNRFNIVRLGVNYHF